VGTVARVGVLGGAFNPPHIGHLVLAQEAAAQLGLRRVHLMTTGRAPHKEIADDPGELTRHEMTEIAAAGNHLLVADSDEVDAVQEGEDPSYTVETLRRLKKREKGGLVLLMGADVAAQFEAWHEPGEILEMARIGVAARPGAMLDEAEAALDRLGADVEEIRMPEIAVSSTRIRRRVGQGRPIRYLVPDGVMEFIEAQGLYRDG
jgi:nicotinate-nucleotide adenylyltransferase